MYFYAMPLFETIVIHYYNPELKNWFAGCAKCLAIDRAANQTYLFFSSI
jgi:hypothetical protein